MNTIETDVLVIGAGPAGCLAAANLHGDGHRVLVVEKQVFPRFVIGESMLPSSMNLLQEAGLLEAVEKQNFMRKFGAVFMRGEQTCNFDFANQFGNGFKYTYQVPRADFDKVLADTLVARGVDIWFKHGVTSVDFQPTHASAVIEKPDGEKVSVRAKFILDCSGYGRVLPRLLDLEAPSELPPRESLFAHVTGDVRPPEREQGKIWICMHPGGAWIWIIPFTNGKTSIGVVASPAFFRQFSGTPEEQLRAIVMGDANAAKRLANMEFAMPPQRIAGYSCTVKKLFGERFALVGNATEFLDPVFSSGVALALASADRAAKTLSRQLRGEAVDWQKDYADYLMQGVDTFRAYINAWYDDKLPTIFFAPNKDQTIMRQVCAVLAGYVWDKTNPYVTHSERALGILVKLVSRPRVAA